MLAEIDQIAGALDAQPQAAARMAERLVRQGITEIRAARSNLLREVLDRVAERARSMVGSAAGEGVGDAIRSVLDRGAAVAAFHIGARREILRSTISDIAAERPRWDAYQLLLCVDEAQNIRRHEVGALSDIHQGRAGAAMSLCAFGLLGMDEALRRVGISHFADGLQIDLGSLKNEDCALAARRCFAQFQVREAEAWVRAITDSSSRWPQHLAS